MKPKRIYKIQYKIAIIFTLIVAVILSWAYLFLNNNLERYAYRRAKANLLKQTRFAKSFLTQYLTRSGLSYEVDEVADNISKDLGMRVTIMGRYGTVIGDSELSGVELRNMENLLERPEIRGAMASGLGEASRFSKAINEDAIYVASTFGRARVEGVIRLAMPVSQINLITARLKELLAIVIGALFVLAAFLIFAASAFISKPIEKISRVAEVIAEGSFSKRIAITKNDEVGEIAKALNRISEQLKSKTDDIARLKKLEEIRRDVITSASKELERPSLSVEKRTTLIGKAMQKRRDYRLKNLMGGFLKHPSRIKPKKRLKKPARIKARKLVRIRARRLKLARIKARKPAKYKS